MLTLKINIKRWFVLMTALALAIVPLAVIIGSGCANNTPQTVAYKSYTGSTVAVQTTLGFWDTYLVGAYARAAGNATNVAKIKDQEHKVKDLYEKWQASMALVADAGAVWSAATHGTNSDLSTSALSAFNQAVNNGAASYIDLQNAVGTFSNKPVQ
jgi:hypothetical protein